MFTVLETVLAFLTMERLAAPMVRIVVCGALFLALLTIWCWANAPKRNDE
jgi:hypothetical protein